MVFFLKRLDWKMNIAIFFLMAASLVSLLSVKPGFFYRQLLWYVFGFFVVFLMVNLEWRPFINYKGVILGIYFFSILLLIATYFWAPITRGIRGWIFIGPFQFQAVEFVKLALIILYANFFSRKHVSIARVSNLISSFIYFLIPGLLVIIQPDLGSTMILFFIWFGFLLVSGIRWRHLVIALVIFSLLAAIMWQVVLKDFQRQRIIGLFLPNRDPLGINYNTIQAKIAIGSAGLFGKGFSQGTQTQLGFLPESQTDFIFAAFIEEWGIVAGVLVVAAFFFLVLRIIQAGLMANNNFNQFICLGTAILFSVQFVMNVGSNLGITPVVGVTFPFLSYGGSSLLTNFTLVGIIQSIVSHRSL